MKMSERSICTPTTMSQCRATGKTKLPAGNACRMILGRFFASSHPKSHPLSASPPQERLGSKNANVIENKQTTGIPNRL
jgi:hypothetical protein